MRIVNGLQKTSRLAISQRSLIATMQLQRGEPPPHYHRTATRRSTHAYWLSSSCSVHPVCVTQFVSYSNEYFISSDPSKFLSHFIRWSIWSGTIIESSRKFIHNNWIRGDAIYIVYSRRGHDIWIIIVVSLLKWRCSICENDELCLIFVVVLPIYGISRFEAMDHIFCDRQTKLSGKFGVSSWATSVRILVIR